MTTSRPNGSYQDHDAPIRYWLPNIFLPNCTTARTMLTRQNATACPDWWNSILLFTFGHPVAPTLVPKIGKLNRISTRFENENDNTSFCKQTDQYTQRKSQFDAKLLRNVFSTTRSNGRRQCASEIWVIVFIERKRNFRCLWKKLTKTCNYIAYCWNLRENCALSLPIFANIRFI